MFEIANTCLVIVDVQGKLAELIYDKESLFNNISILIKASKILEIPILFCQQNPTALGATVPQIAELLDSQPIDKFSFSCFLNEDFKKNLNSLFRKKVILCGIETHICIYQTAIDLNQNGFAVSVVADAVSSRTLANKQIALARLAKADIDISSVEMILFELLRTAKHPNFKEISKLVK